MPLAFPSHQGLILPLWRRFPHRFDGVALSVGAAVPDVVDACAWPLRGELGQWLGHSLLGIVVACLPLGLVLTWLARRIIPRGALVRFDGDHLPPPALGGRAAGSVALGALSHVLFDLVTHDKLVIFLPWYRSDHVFPSWWRHAWTTVALPVYREPYPVAPHTIAWLAASLLGVVLFVRCLGSSRETNTPR